MGVRTRLLCEHGVFVTVFSGAVTPEELDGYSDRLPSTDKGLFLTYVTPEADFSQVSVAVISELRREVCDKLHELYGDRGITSAWVCAPGENEPFADFWSRFREAGGGPPAPVLFHTIQSACDWLGLPEAARRAVIEAIET